jgi:hypothetical protein
MVTAVATNWRNTLLVGVVVVIAALAIAWWWGGTPAYSPSAQGPQPEIVAPTATAPPTGPQPTQP